MGDSQIEENDSIRFTTANLCNFFTKIKIRATIIGPRFKKNENYGGLENYNEIYVKRKILCNGNETNFIFILDLFLVRQNLTAR